MRYSQTRCTPVMRISCLSVCEPEPDIWALVDLFLMPSSWQPGMKSLSTRKHSGLFGVRLHSKEVTAESFMDLFKNIVSGLESRVWYLCEISAFLPQIPAHITLLTSQGIFLLVGYMQPIRLEGLSGFMRCLPGIFVWLGNISTALFLTVCAQGTELALEV